MKKTKTFFASMAVIGALGLAYAANATISNLSRGDAETVTTFKWSNPEGLEDYTAEVGTIEQHNGASNRLNYANTALEVEYKTICLNGKKANLADEDGSDNAAYMVVTPTEPLKEGDVITMTAYRNKNATGKGASAYILFDNETNTSIGGSDGLGFVNLNADGDTPDATEPNTLTYTVTADNAGATSFKMTRAKTSTNLFITHLEITSTASASEPVITPLEVNADAVAGVATWVPSECGYENAEDVSNVNLDGVTITLDKGASSNSPKYYNTGSAVRLYAKNTLAITSDTEATLRKVTITTPSGYPLVNPEANETTEGEEAPNTDVTFEDMGGNVYVWEGNAQTITFTEGGTSGHARIISIAVEYSDQADATVATPEFSVVSGVTVKPGTEVAITCATEGATIYYTTDAEATLDSNCEVYSAPIAIDSYTEIRTFAVVDGEASYAAEATYMTWPVVKNINGIEREDGLQFIYNGDLSVVYANGSYNYVFDANSYSYGLIYARDLGLNKGDLIKGGWEGKVKIYNGLFELEPTSELTVEAGAGMEKEPMEVEPFDASYFLQTYNANQYLSLLDVTFAEATPTSGNFTGTIATEEEDEDGNLIEGVLEVAFRNNFGIESVEPGTYTVTGFVGVYNGSVQFYPTEITATPTTPVIESFVALSDIPVATEVIVGCPVTVVSVGDMIALVYDGTSYYGLGLEDMSAIKAGDVIAAGWTAYNTEFGLHSFEEVTVSESGAELPNPYIADAETLGGLTFAWNYVTIEGVEISEENAAYYNGDSGMCEIEYGDTTIMFGNFMFNEAPAGTYDVTGFFLPYNVFSAIDDDVDDWGSNTTTLVFVPTAFAASTTTISAIEATNDNAVYYNLKGMRVNAPQAGNVYIRVAGTTATKVRVQ